VSQRAVELFVKWQKFGHETLDVAMGHNLVEEAGWIRLSHELEEPSEDSCVRRFLRHDVVNSRFKLREGL
jgi:hypothetical protein